MRDRTIQKSRIGFGNRVSAIERGADKTDEATLAVIQKWQDRFQELEKELDEDINALVDDCPIIDRLCELKGIGKILAAKLVAMIDIEKADTVSALWRYAGYGVIDGERERPQKGEKLHYNARLKTTCYLIGSSFLRCGSDYRRVYDSAKEYYEANRTDWTKAHRHNAAMRKMIKTFLAHLWLVWRELEGLSTRSLYVNDRLDHGHYYTPQEFGWKTDPEGNTK
jgi:hypothetical protein